MTQLGNVSLLFPETSFTRSRSANNSRTDPKNEVQGNAGDAGDSDRRVFNAAAEMVGQVLVELRLVSPVEHDAQKHLQVANRGFVVMAVDGRFW